MKCNDMISGFAVRRVVPVRELDGVLYEMEYVKNGAQLLYFDRDDTNKTFSITFKTIPSDSTGVFHILEHSVLNGSDKYPVKEPFVELLKGSLQTFLNALTYPDHTMYPVSSRNDRDFSNLIDVYMDAVLHPAILKEPNIFRQEGWRYELESEESELKYNGVVFNEMKGAFSSVDRTLLGQMSAALFPDNCYAVESGGDPVYIPDLTYEQFVACHRKYYHPSNARIFLDGRMDLEAVLAQLDSFLRPYDRLEIDTAIPMQKPVAYREIMDEYEISETEDPAGKTHIAFGYVTGTFEEREKNIACSILSDVLCGSNEAPLTKVILEEGLGQDVSCMLYDGMQQNYFNIIVRNTDPDKLPVLRETIRRVLGGLAENGIDRAQLLAAFNRLEFRTHERDFGSYPRGLIYGMTVNETWLYGGLPEQSLETDAIFASLRAGLENGYFESLLRSLILDNPHCAAVCAVPSKTLGEERRRREAEKLAAIKASWSKEELCGVLEMNRTFREWQNREDTPEELDTLPKLALSDIEEKPEKLEAEVRTENGVTVLNYPVNTNGILYFDLYFSAAGLSLEELSLASFLSDVLCYTDTEHYDSLQLQNEIKTHLGNLSVSPEVYARAHATDTCTPCLTLNCSVLAAKKQDALRLIDEVLLHSSFKNETLIRNLLRQGKLVAEQRLTMAGHSYAMTRVSSYLTAAGAAGEYMNGFESYCWMKEQEKTFDTAGKELCSRLDALCKKLFTRERVTVSVTGEGAEADASELVALLPSVPEEAPENRIHALGIRQEGIVIPAGVSFAAKGANLYQIGADYSGSMRVAAQLLTLSYLWNNVRVKGGAYGVGYFARSSGNAAFYSYRDPNASASLDCYDGAADYLAAFCKGDEDLTKFVIGTIADTEPLYTPRSAGKQAAVRYLTGYTYADDCKLRSEILHCTKADLAKLCDVLRAISAENAVCVVGGKDKLDACGTKLSSVLSM